MKIAIIDSGIDITHHRLQGIDIKGFSIIKRDNSWYYENDFHDTIGHGTGCASIIVRHIHNVEIIGIKIFHKNYITTEEYLVKALEWIALHPEIKIVNISLGCTGSASSSLSKICQQLYNTGCIIVAACNNCAGKKDYPSAFPSVIGVLAGQIQRHTEFGIDNDYFIAKGSIQRVATINQRDIITTGTSFATSHMVGIIANILEKKPHYKMKNVVEHLRNNANPNIKSIQNVESRLFFKKPKLISAHFEQHIYKYLTPKLHLKWLGRTAIFPASEKEMKPFQEFPQQCIAEIVARFDYPRTLATINNNYSYKTKHTIPETDDLQKFDSIILGYFFDNLWEGNIEFGKRLLEKSIKSNKNIFAYDIGVSKYAKHLCQELNPVCKCKIYTPTINHLTYNNFSSCEMLPNVSCPVLLVVGTGNKQGKFTTQLRIKEILSHEGYTISFISSEPQGELFGANLTYPYGYRSTISLSPSERLIFLRNINKAVAYFCKPHIIISGTQGAVIPEFPLYSTPYLGSSDAITMIYGLLPDIIVCVINPDDSLEYINQTINAVSLYSKNHLAFFVLSPWIRSSSKNGRVLLDNESIHRRIEYYEKQLGKPVFNIMDRTNDSKIINIIENICS